MHECPAIRRSDLVNRAISTVKDWDYYDPEMRESRHHETLAFLRDYMPLGYSEKMGPWWFYSYELARAGFEADVSDYLEGLSSSEEMSRARTC